MASYTTGPEADLTKKTPEEQEAMDGSPAKIHEPFIEIKFQCGPIAEHGVNGTTIERIIELLLVRLDGFQSGPFKCRENALVITKLQEAYHWLGHRTALRQMQGVEGKNEKHNNGMFLFFP